MSTPFNKTGRKRGLVLRVIRSIAASRRKFTIEVLPFSAPQARRNCLELVRIGELNVVRQGRPGSGGGVIRRAVYKATSKLRPAALTNKHNL